MTCLEEAVLFIPCGDEFYCLLLLILPHVIHSSKADWHVYINMQPRRSWDFFKRILPCSGLGGDSQVFQTANHFELEEGGDHREQVEYTNHRVDVSPVRSTLQLQTANPSPSRTHNLRVPSTPLALLRVATGPSVSTQNL